MDGVLVDSEPLWAVAEKEFIRAHGGTYDQEFFRNTMGWGIRDFMAKVAEQYGLRESLDNLCADLTTRLLALFPDRLAPLPGADMLVRALSSQIPTALASGSPLAVIEAVLDQFDWRSQFTTICSADMVTHGKPAPDLFLLTAEKLNVPPGTCTVIEDSPAGVQAAKRAGMRCIALHHDDRVAESDLVPYADRIVTSLEEIDDSVLWP